MNSVVADKVLSICKCLNKNQVQYLIVGGTAVAYHGYFRWSYDAKGLAAEKFDLDFWYNPTYANYFKLLNALEELGMSVERYKKEKAPDPHRSFFRFEIENFTIDFLPTLKGLQKFLKSFRSRDVVKLNNVEMSFLSIDDLITDKSSDSRSKDLIDIQELKKLRDKKNK